MKFNTGPGVTKLLYTCVSFLISFIGLYMDKIVIFETKNKE
jgi:hypothetical protein